jgi:hypothetical protein
MAQYLGSEVNLAAYMHPNKKEQFNGTAATWNNDCQNCHLEGNTVHCIAPTKR